jgi:hypothetical protein
LNETAVLRPLDRRFPFLQHAWNEALVPRRRASKLSVRPRPDREPNCAPMRAAENLD